MCLLALLEFLVQFEEDRWEPGKWQNLSIFDGNLNSVNLQLSPFVNYQFRVIAINAVGQSQPSLPSARYQTSGACKRSAIYISPDRNVLESVLKQSFSNI